MAWGSRAALYALGSLALLAIWSVLAAIYPTVLVPSPAETLAALLALAASGALAREISVTIARVSIAFSLSLVAGAGLGLLAGARPRLHPLLKPAIDLALSAPPISWVVLALVWFGTGSIAPILTVVIVTLPAVFTAVFEGMRSLDRELVGMARTYGAGRRLLLRDVYLPALAPHLFAAAQVGASLAVRVGVMAELLGSDAGVGHALALARAYLETPQVFAWVGVTVALLLLIEGVVLWPIRRRAEAWRWQA